MADPTERVARPPGVRGRDSATPSTRAGKGVGRPAPAQEAVQRPARAQEGGGRSARAREVVAEGRQLLEEEGAAALTMRRLAERLGIRAPSLYKHLPDKAALEAAIIATGLEEAAAAFEAAVDGVAHPLAEGGVPQTPAEGGGAARPLAERHGATHTRAEGDGGAEPLEALAVAYRRFALAHPHLYRLMNSGPLPRELLPAGLEGRAAAPVLRVAGDQDTARALWAFAHGMVMLELDHRFPPDADLDSAWRAGVAAFRSARPGSRGGRPSSRRPG